MSLAIYFFDSRTGSKPRISACLLPEAADTRPYHPHLRRGRGMDRLGTDGVKRRGREGRGGER